jgi:catechol 2,3-dioxygenase-like lactoylglutathione lyase family enzyme
MLKLRRVMIFVKSIERMTAFYRDTLGLRVIPETSGDQWVELDAGGAVLALHAIPPEIATHIEVTDPPEARAATAIKFVFITEDLNATRAHLIAYGATVYEPRTWGAFDTLDPEGNVFQVATEQPQA